MIIDGYWWLLVIIDDYCDILGIVCTNADTGTLFFVKYLENKYDWYKNYEWVV